MTLSREHPGNGAAGNRLGFHRSSFFIVTSATPGTLPFVPHSHLPSTSASLPALCPAVSSGRVCFSFSHLWPFSFSHRSSFVLVPYVTLDGDAGSLTNFTFPTPSFPVNRVIRVTCPARWTLVTSPVLPKITPGGGRWAIRARRAFRQGPRSSARACVSGERERGPGRFPETDNFEKWRSLLPSPEA